MFAPSPPKRVMPSRSADASSRGCELAFEDGALQRTEFLGQAMTDLEAALDQEDGQKLGGKSAEASRFILRAIDHALDDA